MGKTPENIYRSYIEKYKETSTLFEFIPFVSGNPLFFYMFIVVISTFIEIHFNTYFIVPIIGFLIAAEYRRVFIMREVILDSCMCDEVCLEEELKKNKEYLDRIYEEAFILPSDRESIFQDNLIYCVSRSRKEYIKNHYGFLISIMASQLLFYFFLFIYTS